MAWEDTYENSWRVAFFSTERKDTLGRTVVDTGCPFELVNINGETFFETRPRAFVDGIPGQTSIGLPAGRARETYSDRLSIEFDNVRSYNTDKDTPTFEMHPDV